jgi:hypothetical protein
MHGHKISARRRDRSEVAEVTEAAGVQAIKIDWKEKRVDRERDAAHVAQHEMEEAIEKVKGCERKNAL